MSNKESMSPNDERWLDLDGEEDTAAVLVRDKENTPTSKKREASRKEVDDSPCKKNKGRGDVATRRIGLSFRKTIQSRHVPPQPRVEALEERYEFDPNDELDMELFLEGERGIAPLEKEPRNVPSHAAPSFDLDFDLLLDDEPNDRFQGNPRNNAPVVAQAQVVEVIVAPQPAVVARAPEQNVNVRSYLHSYPDRDVDCPPFLNVPLHRQHKDIFEQLSGMGNRFLCTNHQGRRWWGQYPTHEKTFFQPTSDPSHQIYFPRSPKDIIYTGTWISAVDKDADGKIYPVHIITKNTLGAVKNLLAYPNRIRKIFDGEEFPTHWPHGLEKECVIVIVDRPEQQQQMFRDFEALVNQEGRHALTTVPNLRVYCRGTLSELKTAANCRQRNLLNMVRPNVLPYAERKQALLQIERSEIDSRQDEIDREDFEAVCGQFFSPAPISHELALTHFSLSQLRKFYGVLTQSRNRLIDLKGRVVSHYKGIQMEDPVLKQFLVDMDLSIHARTRTIQKLSELDSQYLQYSRHLSYLFQLAPVLSTEEIEAQIYQQVRTQMYARGAEIVNFETQFSSGKSLIAWLLTRQIPVPVNQPQALINTIVEQMPRPNNFNAVRVF